MQGVAPRRDIRQKAAKRGPADRGGVTSGHGVDISNAAALPRKNHLSRVDLRLLLSRAAHGCDRGREQGGPGAPTGA